MSAIKIVEYRQVTAGSNLKHGAISVGATAACRSIKIPIRTEGQTTVRVAPIHSSVSVNAIEAMQHTHSPTWRNFENRSVAVGSAATSSPVQVSVMTLGQNSWSSRMNWIAVVSPKIV